MADRVPDRGPPAGADGLVRQALQLAFDVARVGARLSPPIEPPRGVRPFLQFTGRLPEAALTALRRGLDDDVDFRLRVADLADEDELGRPGWLLVVRPDGWEGELASLLDDAEAKARAEREEREERSARRRLSHAEQATERAEAAAALARAEMAAATADLVAERRARRAAQDEAERLGRRAGSLEGERDSARRRAGEASAEAERLGAELATARAEAARLGSELDGGTDPGGATNARAGESAPDGGATAPVRAEPAPDLAAAARAVASAASAASALGQALRDASVALVPGSASETRVGSEWPVASDGPDGGGGPDGPDASGPGAAARPATPRARTVPPPRRRPAPLPPAVFDDAPEAAAHLVRVPQALVLVDGYNAAKALWPDVAPLELRERLVDALSALVARTGAVVHVVYDGADLGLPPGRPVTTRGVRVSFSPADVEADDVILDLVDAEPVERPVVVASSDRRVQDGARRRGANVISTAQLAAALGRA